MPLEPLTEAPPEWLNAEARNVWHAIIAATPARLAACDAIALAMTAQGVADWRRSGNSLAQLRFIYRALGDLFVPIAARRRLLFPGRETP